MQDVEGRAIDGLRLGFAPVPELAQDGRGAPAQVGAAGDAPELLGVALLGDGRGDDGFLAGLPKPLPAAEAREFGLEDGGDLQQIVRVLDRVLESSAARAGAAPSWPFARPW